MDGNICKVGDYRFVYIDNYKTDYHQKNDI